MKDALCKAVAPCTWQKASDSFHVPRNLGLMSSAVANSELGALPATETRILSESTHFKSHADVERASLSRDNVTPTKDQSSEYNHRLVDFEGSDDRSNPVNWSKRYKWAIVILLSTVNIIAYVSTNVTIVNSSRLMCWSMLVTLQL